MSLLNVKCECGHDKNYTDEQSDDLDWNEDETLDCPNSCGSKIKYEGWNNPKTGTAVWIDKQE